MKFEYIVLLILAFNVIAAVLKKRKAPPGPEPLPRDTREPAQGDAGDARPGIGRDILEQIAKELGLETEAKPRPRPAPSPYRAEPVPEVVAVVPPATTRSAHKIAPPVAAIETAPARPAAGLDLRDRDALRRAMIAKEVLGPPVSRRRAPR